MPEWLQQSVVLNSSLEPAQIAVRLLVAGIFGAFVAGIYKVSHGKTKADSHTLFATLVLLSILIAMVSIVIGDNVARAFSLVGALSIVRFRTVVEDTRDTAFVIFSVIVGMAAGAGLLLVPLVGVPIVGVTAILLSRSQGTRLKTYERCTLKIRLGLGRDPETLLEPVLGRYVEDVRLISIDTAKQGTSIDLNYTMTLRFPSKMATLVNELNALEGVQSVALLACDSD